MDLFFPFTHWHWFIAAVLLGILEVMAPGAIFLWMGISAALIGFLVLFMPDLEWGYQIITFSILSIITVMTLRKLIVKTAPETDHPQLNSRSAQYIGKTYSLSQDSHNRLSKVKIGDTLWNVELDQDLKQGDEVIINSADGLELKATKA